jgi:LysR family transcriptional regulator, regulator for metE and metH
MIEHSHLKIMQALYSNGTLTEAANALCLSQSALSHQIRYLEKKLEVTLWERDGRRLRLTQAGELLLQTAQQVLPVLKNTEKTLQAYGEGWQGILRIGVECYPCYEWLTRVIGKFMRQMPDVEVDIVSKFQFSGLEGLLNHHIDVLVTPDSGKRESIHYETLSEYELVLLVAENHPLADRNVVFPECLLDTTLLTFPVPVERLDVFTQFLNPANITPANHKTIESIDLMLQMVSLNRGVCILPAWLAEGYCKTMMLKSMRLGKAGLQKKLLLGLRQNDRNIAYIEQFMNIGKQAAIKSFLRVE